MSKLSPKLMWPVPFDTDSEYFMRPPLAYLLRKEPGAVPVLLNDGILQALFMLQQSDHDLIGFLAGASAQDSEGRPFLLVVGAFPAKSFAPEFSALEPEKLNRNIDDYCASRYPGLQVVGWYRCRARGQLGLSPQELDFHRGCFSCEQQICLLLDSAKHQAGIHCWGPSPTSNRPVTESVTGSEQIPSPTERCVHGPRGFYLFQPGPRFTELVQCVPKERPAAAEAPIADFSPEYAVVGQAVWKYQPDERFRRRPPVLRSQGSSANKSTSREARPIPRVLGIDSLTCGDANRPRVVPGGALGSSRGSDLSSETSPFSDDKREVAKSAGSDISAHDPTTIVPSRLGVDKATLKYLIDGLEEGVRARDCTFSLVKTPSDGDELTFIVKVAPGRNLGAHDLTTAGLEVRIRPTDLTARPRIMFKGELRRSVDDAWWERHGQVAREPLDRICQYVDIVIKDLSP